MSRTTDATWGVAGLQAVEVPGVENVRCDDVQGHLQWRGMVGQCLQICGADGLAAEEVETQLREVAEMFAREQRKEIDLVDFTQAEVEVHTDTDIEEK